MAAYPLCPSCKAPLSDLPPGEHPRCRACGAEVRFPAQGSGVAGRRVGWGCATLLGAIVGAAVALGAAGVRWWRLPETAPAPSHAPPSTPPAPVSTVAWSASGGAYYWAGVFPLVGPFFGEGREDVLGLMRDAMGQTGTIVAVDGETFQVRWSSPAGGYAGLWTTQLAVVGQLAAWAQGDGVVHVTDLATGRPLRTIHVDDGAAGLCPHPTEKGRALYVGSHGLRATVDLEGGTSTADKGAAACPAAGEPGARPVTARTALPPPPEGTEFSSIALPHGNHAPALADGSLGVAVATKRPGFPIPSIVGFGLADRKVRWSTVIGKPGAPPPSVLALDAGGGQVVLFLNGDKAARIAALDAETGAPAWETAVPCEARAFRLGPSRVYAMGMVQLHVFDRRSGRLLRSLGSVGEPFCR